MKETTFNSLDSSKKQDIIQEFKQSPVNEREKEILVNHTITQIKYSCYLASGEPKSTVKCNICRKKIALEQECSILKRYSKDEENHKDPEILCKECFENPKFNSEKEIGLLFKGELSRRRTRPGDSCTEPYIFYTDPREETLKIIRSCEERENKKWF